MQADLAPLFPDEPPGASCPLIQTSDGDLSYHGADGAVKLYFTRDDIDAVDKGIVQARRRARCVRASLRIVYVCRGKTRLVVVARAARATRASAGCAISASGWRTRSTWVRLRLLASTCASTPPRSPGTRH